MTWSLIECKTGESFIGEIVTTIIWISLRPALSVASKVKASVPNQSWSIGLKVIVKSLIFIDGIIFTPSEIL